MKNPNNIILIGMKNCGKSSVARDISIRTGMKVIETDKLIEQIFHNITGETKTFREIFKEKGEFFFRNLEKRILETLVDLNLQDYVIDTGGGIISDISNKSLLNKIGKIVFLNLDIVENYARMIPNGLPVSLQDVENPREEFEKRFKLREPVYQSFADKVLVTTGLKVEEISNLILNTN